MKKLLLILLLVCLTGCGKSRKQLHIYAWAEMFDPELIEQFEKQCDCRVVIDTYDSNEMLYSKLRSGARGYDLILPSHYIEEVMVKRDMLELLDLDKIPNLRYLDRTFFDFIQIPKYRYSVPYSISYTGIGYRSDRVNKIDPTWCIFGDPEYRGRMTILNDYRESLGIALICLGYDPNTIDEQEVEQAADLLIKWKNNIAKFENEQYKNGIATAEFLIVQSYSSDILQVQSENPHVSFVLPNEGALISYDQFAIPKGAKNKDLAYQFINFLYNPKISAQTMSRIFVMIPNKEAYQYLPQKLQKSTILFPDEEKLKRLHSIRDLGENIRLYQKAWERVKESW